MNFDVRLPQEGEEGEANTLQVLQAGVHVEDPGVLPLDTEIHGEGDAGLHVADLQHIDINQNEGGRSDIPQISPEYEESPLPPEFPDCQVSGAPAYHNLHGCRNRWSTA